MTDCTYGIFNNNMCNNGKDSRLEITKEKFEELYKKILGVEVLVQIHSISSVATEKRIGALTPEMKFPEIQIRFVAPVFIFSEEEPKFVMEQFTANFDDERRKHLENEIYDLIGGQHNAFSETGKRLLSDGLIDDFTENDFIELKRKFLQRQKWRKQMFDENKVKTNLGWVVFHKMQEQEITFMDENKLEQRLYDLIKYPVIEIDTENDTYFEL